MNDINKRLNAYIETHPFNAGDSRCETVLDQLYQAYAESHESDPVLPPMYCIRTQNLC